MTKSKVAILLTDYSPDYVDEFGNFADQSINLLKNAGSNLEFEIYDAIKSEFPTEDELRHIRAFWITGSTSDSFSDEPWILKLVEFIQHIYNDHSIPFIGICFGHQILSRALGGKVGRNPNGWELGTVEFTLSDNKEVQELFDNKDTFRIVEVHQDVVTEAPLDWITIGSNNHTKHQGFYKRGKILSFQGHPEFNDKLVDTITRKLYKNDKIDKSVLENSLDSISSIKHQGVDAAKVILNFIE